MGARITPRELFRMAGIDPKTGLPIRLGMDEEALRNSIKMSVDIADQQDAINAVQWFGCPLGLDGQMIERILYWKGQAVLFAREVEGQPKFFFLPFALEGEIDIYGRYVHVKPVKFAAGKEEAFITGLRLKVVYDIGEYQEDPYSCGVIFWDYSRGISQNIIARQILNEGIRSVEADMIPFMRTCLLNSTGVQGMRVGTEAEKANVKAASEAINHAAIVGEKYIPIVGNQEFQDLTPGAVGKAEEFMKAMESLDNYRISTHGIKNGGIFQKNAHMLQTEQDMAGGDTSTIQDKLTTRQISCLLAKDVFDIDMWCDVGQAAAPSDVNGDGLTVDDNSMMLEGGGGNESESV